MATKLESLPDVERISPTVIRILGGNPGKVTWYRHQSWTLFADGLDSSLFKVDETSDGLKDCSPGIGTNTYLVGQGSRRLLIDTGEGKPEWLKLLKDTLASEKATLDKVVVTHWHSDHIGGLKDVLTLSPKPTVYKSQIKEAQGLEDIKDGQKFEVEGATIRAFHCPGHTQDHMAFIFEEEDAMFTGDNVLGHGTAVFEDLSTYLDSLEKMSHQVLGRGYPGHGAVIGECRAKIIEYIEHRKMREKEVLEVLSGDIERGLGSMDFVKIIYQDVPENLHVAAARGVVQILEKLAGEGKVHHNKEADTWTLNRKAVL